MRKIFDEVKDDILIAHVHWTKHNKGGIQIFIETSIELKHSSMMLLF
jgi:hypothetical protein